MWWTLWEETFKTWHRIPHESHTSILIITKPDKFNLRCKRWKLSKVIVNCCLQNYNWIEVLSMPMECWCLFHSWKCIIINIISFFCFFFFFFVSINVYEECVLTLGMSFPPWMVAPFKYHHIIIITWSKYVSQLWIHSIGSKLLMEAGKILILAFYCIIFIVIAISSITPKTTSTDDGTLSLCPVYPHIAHAKNSKIIWICVIMRGVKENENEKCSLTYTHTQKKEKKKRRRFLYIWEWYYMGVIICNVCVRVLI